MKNFTKKLLFLGIFLTCALCAKDNSDVDSLELHPLLYEIAQDTNSYTITFMRKKCSWLQRIATKETFTVEIDQALDYSIRYGKIDIIKEGLKKYAQINKSVYLEQILEIQVPALTVNQFNVRAAGISIPALTIFTGAIPLRSSQWQREDLITIALFALIGLAISAIIWHEFKNQGKDLLACIKIELSELNLPIIDKEKTKTLLKKLYKFFPKENYFIIDAKLKALA